jgi:DNA-directed RNA polymerase specialized sigma24 family protein
MANADRLDYDSIAESLGMRRGAVGPTRGRCLDKLRKILEDDPDWSGGGQRYGD